MEWYAAGEGGEFWPQLRQNVDEKLMIMLYPLFSWPHHYQPVFPEVGAEPEVRTCCAPQIR